MKICLYAQKQMLKFTVKTEWIDNVCARLMFELFYNELIRSRLVSYLINWQLTTAAQTVSVEKKTKQKKIDDKSMHTAVSSEHREKKKNIILQQNMIFFSFTHIT